MSAEIVPFDYHGRSVRTVTVAGDPWFVVADLCSVLDLGNSTMAVQGLRKDDLSKVDVIDSIGRSQRTLILNEVGMYRLILRSKKPDAERFQDWICREVLPAIRKTGKYLSGEKIAVNVPFLLPGPKPRQEFFPTNFSKSFSGSKASRRCRRTKPGGLPKTL